MIHFPDVTGSCGEFDDVKSPVHRRNILPVTPSAYNWSRDIYDVDADIYDVTTSRRPAIGQLGSETADWLAAKLFGMYGRFDINGCHMHARMHARKHARLQARKNVLRNIT